MLRLPTLIVETTVRQISDMDDSSIPLKIRVPFPSTTTVPFKSSPIKPAAQITLFGIKSMFAASVSPISFSACASGLVCPTSFISNLGDTICRACPPSRTPSTETLLDVIDSPAILTSPEELNTEMKISGPFCGNDGLRKSNAICRTVPACVSDCTVRMRVKFEKFARNKSLEFPINKSGIAGCR